MSSNSYTIQISREQMSLIHVALRLLRASKTEQRFTVQNIQQMEELDALIDMSNQTHPDPQLRPTPGYDIKFDADGHPSKRQDPLNGWCL